GHRPGQKDPDPGSPRSLPGGCRRTAAARAASLDRRVQGNHQVPLEGRSGAAPWTEVMLRNLLARFGFGSSADDHHPHGHDHAHGPAHVVAHAHIHGGVDPSIATAAKGIWAVKWSFAILGVTAALQLAVVIASGSVALLADTIHNIGDAGTAIPLWIAFALV